MSYSPWKLPENEERLRKAVAQSNSIAGTLRNLGLMGIGGNYKTIKHHIARLDIDTSHHSGQGWSKERYIEPNNNSRKETWKRYMIKKHGHFCMSCKLSSWQGKSIPLELEHVDGVSSNHSEENLKLLCPNCHAMTPTYRRRKTASTNSPMAEASDLSPDK